MSDEHANRARRDDPPWTRSLRVTTRFAVGTVLAVGDHAATVVRTATERADAEADRAGAAGGSTTDIARTATDLVPTPAAPMPATPSPATPGPPLRSMLIGALFAAEDRMVDLTVALARATPLVTRPWNTALMRPVRDRVDAALHDLAERGAAEEQVARATAAHAFDATVESVTASPVIDETVNEIVERIIDPVLQMAVPKALADLQGQPEALVPLVQSIVGQVLQPILDEALPEVIDQMKGQPELLVPFVESLVNEIIDPVLQLALPKAIEYLNEDPTVVRDLVRDQSTGIAGELAGTVRTRAVTVDDRIDRIASRILRRRPPALEPTAEPLDALPPAPTEGADR